MKLLEIIANEAFSIAIVENGTDVENWNRRTSKLSGEIVFDRSATAGNISVIVNSNCT